MAGIIYPSIAESLLPAMQMERTNEQNALARANERRLQRQEDEDTQAKQYVGPALSGDKDALSKLAAGSPRTAMALAPLLDRLDEHQRNKIKEMSNWTTQTAMGVLKAPKEQRAAAYAAALADGKMRGYDLSSMPPEYDRTVDGRLQFHIDRAEPLETYFKRQAEMPTPMGPGGGGGAPGGAPGYGDAANAIAGIESNGRYDALGPPTPQGQAIGKYQVMPANVGPWTKEILGQEMTPQQFRDSPQAQEAVFKGKFGQYAQKYGPEGAARAWFAGEGGMNNPNAADVNGMTVQRYGQRFAQAYGAGPQGGPPAGPQIAQGDAVALGMPAQPAAPPLHTPEEVRTLHSALPPGARMLGVNGQPAYDKAGRLLIRLPNGATDSIEVPKVENSKPSALGGTGLIYDPATKTAFDPLFGKTYKLGPNGFMAADGGTGMAPGGVPIPQGDMNAPGMPAPGGRDEAFLATLPPEMQSMVKSYADGKMQFPGGAAMRSPQMVRILQAVSQYDPTFDAINYGARASTAKDFASGQSAKNITSFNTLIGHLGALHDAANKLNNNSIRPLNYAQNYIQDTFGDKRITNFAAIKGAVADEAAKAFKGSNISEGEIKRWETTLNDSMSPDQLQGSIQTLVELLDSRIHALGEQYQRGMGKASDGYQLLDPKSRQSLDYIKKNPVGQSKKEEAPASTAAASAPKAGTVDGGYLFKGGDPSNKENWEKVQ